LGSSIYWRRGRNHRWGSCLWERSTTGDGLGRLLHKGARRKKEDLEKDER